MNIHRSAVSACVLRGIDNVKPYLIEEETIHDQL
jgi:hypothetical protein